MSRNSSSDSWLFALVSRRRESFPVRTTWVYAADLTAARSTGSGNHVPNSMELARLKDLLSRTYGPGYSAEDLVRDPLRPFSPPVH